MFEELNYSRRHFLSAAAITIAAGPLSMIGSADARPTIVSRVKTKTARQESATSFDTTKQINAGVLNIGYAEAGPADGTAVVLLHGWPYDIYSFADVAPVLAAKGYRVIIPYLRGFGTTRFLSNETFRNGQPAALALDIIALMDALKIEKAILAGFSTGAHARPPSSLRYGRNAAKPWFQSVAT